MCCILIDADRFSFASQLKPIVVARLVTTLLSNTRFVFQVNDLFVQLKLRVQAESNPNYAYLQNIFRFSVLIDAEIMCHLLEVLKYLNDFLLALVLVNFTLIYVQLLVK